MATGREKRRHRRVTGDFPLKYRTLEDNPYSGGFTRNIAEGGVRFIGHRFIPLATNLTLNLSLPTTARRLNALGKVVWIRKVPTGERYEIGLEFIDISDDDKREIRTVTYPE